MMNLLVTGATGFIGNSLFERLLVESSYTPVAATRTDNINKSPYVSVGDISADTNWSIALSGIEVVIHAAGRAHISDETHDKSLVEYRRVNTEGTLNLAYQAADKGIRRLVFISSIGVSGELSDQPFREQDTPNPVNPYTISKLEAEQGLREIAAETGMEVVIIRPPLVYGSQAPGNFYRLLHMISQSFPMPFGAIHNRRSFVALDNLVDLIVTCIDHPAAANQIFLAADGEDLSTTVLLQKIGKAMGKSTRLIPVPVGLLKLVASMLGKKAVAERLCGSLQVDISKARELLGWEPPISVDEGLRRAVEGFKKK